MNWFEKIVRNCGSCVKFRVPKDFRKYYADYVHTNHTANPNYKVVKISLLTLIFVELEVRFLQR